GCCAEAKGTTAHSPAAARRRVVFIDASTPADLEFSAPVSCPSTASLNRGSRRLPGRASPAQIGADSTGARHCDQLSCFVVVAAYTREVAARPAIHLMQRFQGSDTYVATADLKLAVNAALTLQRPLLIKGEPGTGKTMLAEEVARALSMPLLAWHIKSTTKAQQGLYEYDAVSRLRDSQLGDERVKDIHQYIVRGVLWQAFESPQPSVLLIDEIDQADIEFPNDLLRELDRMEFFVYETRQTIVARHRPLVVITSNNEKELPDAFLRRCFFHYIKFPDKETMQSIV